MTRFSAVDGLRGLIMIFMAIDHTNAFVSRQHSSEFWNGAISTYDSTFAFFTRWIAHLCAPGFFFLMGAGIYWFASSRQEAGWTEGQVMRHTASRGLAIFLVGQFFETSVIYLTGLLKPPQSLRRWSLARRRFSFTSCTSTYWPLSASHCSLRQLRLRPPTQSG